MPRTVSDLLLASFFAFALFGNVTVDVWMGFDVDLLDSGFPPDSLAAQYHRLVWQSGRDYDPLFIDNSGYMRASALGTAVLYFPFYPLAIGALLAGQGLGSPGSLTRRYGHVYGCGMLLNMTIVLAMEAIELFCGTALAPSLGAYWIPCGAYWLVPLLVLRRLWREDAESVDKRHRE